MQLKSLCGCEELVFFPVLILRDSNVPIDPEAGLPICKKLEHIGSVDPGQTDIHCELDDPVN